MFNQKLTPLQTPINVSNHSTSIVGSSMEVEYANRARYLVKWANGASLNATISIQFSDDAVTWFDLPFGSSMILNGDKGFHYINTSEILFKYMRPFINFIAGQADIVVTAKATNL